MPTNLAIDDELLEEALRVGGRRTKRDTVNEALAEYVQRRKRRFINTGRPRARRQTLRNTCIARCNRRTRKQQRRRRVGRCRKARNFIFVEIREARELRRRTGAAQQFSNRRGCFE